MAAINPSDITIKRNLFKSSKLTIDLFMYAPQALLSGASYTINANPIVTFRFLNPYSTNNGVDTSYKMTPRNHFKILKFFNTAVSWFYDDNLKDLFLINEDEELVFNADYNHISASLTKSKFETGMMKIMPSLIIYDQDRYEGVYLYINHLENLITLTKDELEGILHLVKNFNFNSEVSNCITALNYIERIGNTTTDSASWYRKSSYNANGKYVSPFDKK